MNRSQLEESVRCEYGSGVEAEKYLQKFINLWASLPKNMEKHNCDATKYLLNCMKRMELNDYSMSQRFKELIKFYKMSLREIERSLTNYSIFFNAIGGSLNGNYEYLGAYLCVIKVLYPSTYKKLPHNGISFDQLIKETELTDLVTDSWSEKLESHPLKLFLRLFLASEKEKKVLLEKEREFSDMWEDGDPIKDICRLLDSFQDR